MLTHAHNRTGFGRDGGASAASRAAVRAWRIAGGGGEGVGSDPGQCPPLVPRMEGPGTGGTERRGRAGGKPRLDTAQLAGVARALRNSPRAHGFSTDLWTLPRVAEVIE